MSPQEQEPESVVAQEGQRPQAMATPQQLQQPAMDLPQVPWQ